MHINNDNTSAESVFAPKSKGVAAWVISCLHDMFAAGNTISWLAFNLFVFDVFVLDKLIYTNVFETDIFDCFKFCRLLYLQ